MTQSVLSRVYSDTPAESVGMFPGDVLVNIGDYDIKRVSDVRNAIFYTREGQFVSVKVKRDNEEIDYNMRVAVKQIEDLVEDIELTQELSKGDLKQTLSPYKQATIKDEELEEPGKPPASDYVPEDE